MNFKVETYNSDFMVGDESINIDCRSNYKAAITHNEIIESIASLQENRSLPLL